MGGRRAEQHMGQYGPGERCLPVRARPAEKKPRRRLTQRRSQDCVGRRLCGARNGILACQWPASTAPMRPVSDAPSRLTARRRRRSRRTSNHLDLEALAT